MNKRSRTLLSGAGAGLLVLSLAACAPGAGGSSSNDEDTGDVSTDISDVEDMTLTVWDQEVRGGQNEQMEQLNAAFEEKYPNITIERNSQSFEDLGTTLRLALTDTDAPDVVQANNGRNSMGAFVEAGQLIPLDAYADAYGWSDRFSENVLQYSTYSDDATTFGEGDLYGLPQVGEVVGVYYSKSKLEALGLDVPETWSDFTDAVDAASADGPALQLGNIDQWPAGHVFGPIQGQFVDAADITALGLGNAGASWTTAENVDAANELQEWVDAGYFNDGINGTDYDAAWQAFGAGEGTFLMAGSWLAPDIEDAMGDDVGFFAPTRDDGSIATTGGTGLPFTITSAAENNDVAAAYIDFITSDEAMDVLAETGNLPVNRTAELAPDSGVLADIYTVFGEVTESGDLLPYLDYATPTFGDTLGQSLQDLIDGRVDAEAFTEQLEADYAGFTSSDE